MDNDGTYTQSELEGLTKAQLLDLAHELGVEGLTTKSLKVDVVTAILNR